MRIEVVADEEEKLSPQNVVARGEKNRQDLEVAPTSDGENLTPEADASSKQRVSAENPGIGIF